MDDNSSCKISLCIGHTDNTDATDNHRFFIFYMIHTFT